MSDWNSMYNDFGDIDSQAPDDQGHSNAGRVEFPDKFYCNAEIVAAEYKMLTKAGHQLPHLNLKFAVTDDGDFKGRWLWKDLPMANAPYNGNLVNYTKEDLKRCGILGFSLRTEADAGNLAQKLAGEGRIVSLGRKVDSSGYAKVYINGFKGYKSAQPDVQQGAVSHGAMAVPF